MVTGLMLRASSDVLNRAGNEISRKGYTPLRLASELSLAMQLVENFLNGEIVDRHTYDLVCEKLNIPLNTSQETLSENVELINSQVPKSNISNNGAGSVPDSNNTSPSARTNKNSSQNLPVNSNVKSPIKSNQNIDGFLQSLRQSISASLIRQCDRLRVVDINAPLYLHDLYTDINVFTDLPSSQYIDLNEAFESVSPEQYDRFYLAKLQPSTTPANQALEEYKQLLLTGDLGSGKTTLLKYWAITCITGKTLSDYLPVFLPLRSLVLFNAEHRNLDNPLTWLKTQIISYGLSDELLDRLTDSQVLEQLLSEGHFLLLWDELDEIPEIHRNVVAQQILNFSDRYPQNRMVLSTRNPIYGHILQSFKTLKIAPFQESQIATFASKWFQTTCSQKPKKTEDFQQLLATNQPLAEIASNPLFLTHLCTTFNNLEYIKPNFYQEILNLLLTTWEQTKCLPNPANQTLSISQKQDLLSYIAIVSLDRHGYIWQNYQLEDDFQACIASSRNLSTLAIDREQLVQTLKWQHSLLLEYAKGIYGLPYITLHDYLAAYRISNSTPAAVQKYLLERIHLKRWHGVIVMTVSISQQAEQMLQLMKRKIDELVVADPHLQSFLAWVMQQSIHIKTSYKAVTIRALYLDIDLENTRSLDRARALDLAHSRSLERAQNRASGINNSMETEMDIDYTINLALNLDLALYFINHPVLELACTLEPELSKGLQFLRRKFPDHAKDRTKFAKWWQAKGLEWSKKLRTLMVQHRKSSQEWQFSENQLKLLRTYHDANKLLIECLNNAEYVSPLVKNQIESTLLSPQSEHKILKY